MRTTINLDDDVLSRAHALSGITDRTALLHKSLETMIALESARRLARLGGSDPQAEAPPRRKSDAVSH